eukprot:3588244-Prymnesium_polylepis.2
MAEVINAQRTKTGLLHRVSHVEVMFLGAQNAVHEDDCLSTACNVARCAERGRDGRGMATSCGAGRPALIICCRGGSPRRGPQAQS